MEEKKISSTKNIAKNTFMLYFRQILIMLVSLYTVRIVLNVLGAEDYGIYNVVAGVVTMFSFLSGAMATASQRYFSFDLGKNDEEHLKITFSITFQIYFLLALIVILFAETIGLWFVNNKLVIPPERIIAANWIYQAAIFSFLMTLITTPYMASIIAHENMNVYAYVSIIEAGLKLGIVYLLCVLPYDKLIIYGFLLAIVSFINTALYRIYCHKNYKECKLRFVKNWPLFKELVSYSGWNLFGSIAGVVRNQGVTTILNIFFNPIVVAARSIALQVNVTLANFANNFVTAIKPSIIKEYANNNKERVLELVKFSSKVTCCLLSIIIAPLFTKMDFILELWLKNVPENTILFSKITVIEVLIESVSYPVQIAIQATGKIKWYQIIVGSILILNIPISIIFLRFCNNPCIVFYISLVLVFIANILRFIIMSKQYKIQFRKFIFLCLRVYIPVIVGILLASFIIEKILAVSLISNLLECFFVCLFMVLINYLFCFSKDERIKIKKMLFKREAK